MDRAERKICAACKTAKRKCSKSLPSCTRCELRGLDCVYQSKPSMVVYRPDGQKGGVSKSRDEFHLQTPGTIIRGRTHPPSINLSLPANSVCPSLNDLRTAWFLTPETWMVAPIDPALLTPVSVTVVKRYMAQTQEWLQDWVKTGSNPFIHAELYGKTMPDCVQDAFMALSTYVSRTDATGDLVQSLVESKADQLVETQRCQDAPADILEHIGRVQSLLIYTIIRLFDGDVRQRYRAERHLSILHTWTRTMISHASYCALDDTLLLSNSLTTYTSPNLAIPHIPTSLSQEQLLWHAWILSESVRRTWLVSEIVQSIYIMLQKGSAQCPGSVMVTTRRGVWDADTAFKWTKLCAERSVGFMHRSETQMVMMERTLEEVDAFSLAIMKLDFGLERMERWGLITDD